MKLKAIHVYQTVLFNRKNVNFFSDNTSLGLGGLDIEYLPGMQAIRVKSDKDDVLIFCTNVAYAVPMDAKNVDDIIKNRGNIKNVDTSKAVK